ncbi:hypothetical protein [Microbacterium sp.]|uniref:hypothetical protein n=1 Tax=Microbacterium sp. TaxID=51671 RepID=UPI001ACA9908|nr:hypothetical protein [Microbacterium sp.]MBN9157350.1 hypothetical protein [Microbacterium sp.]
MSPRLRSLLSPLLGSLAFAVAVAVVAVTTAASARAAETTQTVQGRYVQIVSRADWNAAASMGPQTRVPWALVVRVQAPAPGTVRLGISATGDAPVRADVRLCAVAWQGATCSAGERSLRADWAIPRDGRTIELAEMPADAVAHLRLEVRMASGPTTGSTRVLVHADAFGDQVQTGPTGELAATGGSVPVFALGGAAVLVVVAVLLLGGRRRRGEG